MVTVKEVINWAEDLANRGVGIDQDGVYGTQCVDLPNAISSKFFGKPLWGNAIDLLNSAKSNGYTVEYNVVGDVNSKPNAGAIFVMDTTYLYGHPFGHTGLVIADSDGYTMQTIEQNVDGNADCLYVGGPARYKTRDFSGIVGWFYPPYDIDLKLDNPNLMSLDKVRVFTVTADKLNVRTAPSTDAEIVFTYDKGDTFNYNEYCYTDDYEWLSYVSNNGERRFIASCELESNTDFGTWKYK